MALLNRLRCWFGNDCDCAPTKHVIENTGSATTKDGGNATTGINGNISPGTRLTVRNTGSATATGGGNATSGISYTDEVR